MTEAARATEAPATAPELEAVIGLEIHVQLATTSKLFCGDTNEFGAPPNTHVCPVCLGLPGALPVINRQAVELGARTALALDCTVHLRSIFARKNYFYPDLPKGYQISQFEHPLATDGWLDAPGEDGADARRVRIRRIHLEEDAGKSLHDRIPSATAVDLNRTGVPLVEIVTEPDLRSPETARSFMVRLKQILEYLEVSDCNMEEGSLRVDANVSVRRRGAPLGTKTEVKNMNSFSNLERALQFEIARQMEIVSGGGTVVHQTLLWDAGRGEARPMRSKEESHDYRYFPDPDLPLLEIEEAVLQALRDALPELPLARLERFQRQFNLTPAHAEVLTATRALADYFEEVVQAGADAQDAASWIMGEVLAAINTAASSLAEFRVRPRMLAELLQLLRSGTISRPIARQVFSRMVESGEHAPAIVEAEGLVQVQDRDALDAWVEEVLRENPEAVARFRGGEAKLMGFFVGAVMKLSAGKADPKQVSALLRERLHA